MKRFLALLLALALLAMLPAYAATSQGHEHRWRERSRREATCTETGSITYFCYCGETKTETIPKSKHDWTKWKTVREATCTERGEETRKCKVCGKKDTRKTDKKAHQFGEWTITVAPTDFSMGTRAATCQVCGTEVTEDFYPDPTYKRGDSGDGVRSMQEALNAKGYDCGRADGAFGGKTESAVSAFESANGVEPDGIAWPGVLNMLGLVRSGTPDAGTKRLTIRIVPMEKSGDEQRFALGEQITFRTTVENPNDFDVKIKSLYNYPRNDTGGVVIAADFTIAAHGSFTLDRKITVEESDLSAGMVKNRARVVPDGDSGLGSVWSDGCQAYVLTTVLAEGKQQLGLSMKVKEAQEVFYLGDRVTFVAVVDNPNDFDVPIAQIADRYNGEKDCEKPVKNVTIAAHGHLEFDFEHEIGENDVSRGYAWDHACVVPEASTGLPAKWCDGVNAHTAEKAPAAVSPAASEEEPAVTLEVKPSTEQDVFAVGEKIDFAVLAYNHTAVDVMNYTCEGFDGFGNSREKSSAKYIPAHNHAMHNESYTFTDADAGKGTITLRWEAKANDKASGSPIDIAPVELTYKVVPKGAEYEWTPPAESFDKVTVSLQVFTKPKDEKGYAVDERVYYAILVHNNSGANLINVNIWDTLHGLNEGDRVCHLDNTVSPTGLICPKFEHFVTLEEAQNGAVVNTAHVEWEDPYGGKHEGDSEPFNLDAYYEAPVGPEIPDVPEETGEPGIELTVKPKTFPASGDLMADDVLEFDAYLRNTGAVDMMSGRVEMHAHGHALDGGVLGAFAAGLISEPVHVSYTVTQDDLDAGALTLRFKGVGYPEGSDGSVKAEDVVLTYEFAAPSDINVWADDVPAGKYKAGDMLHVVCGLDTLSPTATLQLTKLDMTDARPNDAISNEPWMDYTAPTLLPDSTFNFSVDLEVDDGDVGRGWGWRTLMADAVDPETGAASSDTYVIMYALQKDGPSIMLLAQDTAGLSGRFGDALPVQCTMVNNGDVDLKLKDYASGADGGNIATNDYDDVPSNYFDYFAAGKSFHFVNHVAISAGDVKLAHANGGLFDRRLEVYALALDTGETVMDDAAFHVALIEDEPEEEETPETDEAVTVVKSFQPSADPKGFVQGEVIHYEITVNNNTDAPMTEVEVYDPLKGSAEDMMVDMILEIAPHSSETVTFDHEVTPGDVDTGSVTNTAFATWDWGNGSMRRDSNTVIAYTWKPDDNQAVSLVKTVENLPERGYFLEDEIVDFAITVYNNTDNDYKNVVITDPLSDAPDQVVAAYPVLAAHSSQTVHLYYTVTDIDVGNLEVVNVAYAECRIHKRLLFRVASNPARAPTGRIPDDPFGVITGAEVTKEEISYPLTSPYYYVHGETIEYKITVHNYGETKLDEVIVYDTLEGGSGEIAAIENFYPDDTRTYTFTHKVSKSDVKHHKVVNYAWIEWTIDGVTSEAWSEPVISPTGGESESEPEDCCVRTLVDAADEGRTYTLDYCHAHKPVADQVAALVEAAATDEAKLAAWEQAVQLWTDALNAEYDALTADADSAERAIIESEKTLFFEQIDARRAALALEYPEDAALVAKLTSEQLMNRTADLCYEAHTAPSARADSLAGHAVTLTGGEGPIECRREVEATDTGARYTEITCETHRAAETATLALAEGADVEAWRGNVRLWLVELNAQTNVRYLEASAEDREIIAAERNAFGAWLMARQDFLNLMYPGKPAIVDEALAQTVRARVLDICVDAE